jgi:hypothetical protein
VTAIQYVFQAWISDNKTTGRVIRDFMTVQMVEVELLSGWIRESNMLAFYFCHKKLPNSHICCSGMEGKILCLKKIKTVQ